MRKNVGANRPRSSTSAKLTRSPVQAANDHARTRRRHALHSFRALRHRRQPLESTHRRSARARRDRRVSRARRRRPMRSTSCACPVRGKFRSPRRGSPRRATCRDRCARLRRARRHAPLRTRRRRLRAGLDARLARLPRAGAQRRARGRDATTTRKPAPAARTATKARKSRSPRSKWWISWLNGPMAERILISHVHRIAAAESAR